MDPDMILALVYVCIVGASIGSFSGLIPGIHVNTLAVIILSLHSTLESWISYLVPHDIAPMMLACCIISATVVHSATDFVPSVFFGIPDSDNALNILPGHKMVLMGQGMTAVRCAAIGSIVGAFVSIVVSIPMFYLLANGFGEYLDGLTIGVLVTILTMMVLRERRRRRLLGLILIIISGMIGCITMNMELPLTNVFDMEPEIMFPMLSGLFGIPALLFTSPSGEIPSQEDPDRFPIGPIPGLKGALTGSVIGWYPGITSSCGATVAGTVFGEEDEKGYVSMVSSIGTAATMFTFIALAVSGKERSGSMSVVNGILEGASIQPGNDLFTAVMLTMAISSILAYLIMISAGHIMCRIVENISIPVMNTIILSLMIVLTVLFTGYWGLVLLSLCTLIGMIPVIMDSNRMHLTGCLIVPVLMFKLGLM